ncbi:MAG: ribonuclease Z [Clostridia bacterium]|nr:ribonuclease Z [Clostridia bacterium]
MRPDADKERSGGPGFDRILCPRQMKAIVCVDNGGGMMFNRRRQSRDQEVRRRLGQISSGGTLRMDAYSARQFAGNLPDNAEVSEDFLDSAGPDDFCFVEDRDLTPHLGQIDELIVFRWNRDYPRDQVLPVELADWQCISSQDFAGSSHDKITQEVYIR